VDPAILSELESEDGEGNAKRMFCPEEDCAGIILLMEIHYNTHPLILAYSAPTKEGIWEWAVKQMYQYCKSCDLAALWAYLWGNWYQPRRWEIWVHSVVDEISRLCTTMIMESQ